MIKQFFLLQFNPDFDISNLEHIFQKWHELTAIDGVEKIETGANIHPQRYQHKFSHAVITYFSNEEAMQTLLANDSYINLVQEINEGIEQVLIFAMKIDDGSGTEVVRKGRGPVPARAEISIGATVWGIEKKNYKNGILTEGTVEEILTNKPFHPRGIKVRFKDGTIARVQSLTNPSAND